MGTKPKMTGAQEKKKKILSSQVDESLLCCPPPSSACPSHILTSLWLLYGVIAALLFGFEEAHGEEASRLQTQHQYDATDETGHVKLGLGELWG